MLVFWISMAKMLMDITLSIESMHGEENFLALLFGAYAVADLAAGLLSIR